MNAKRGRIVLGVVVVLLALLGVVTAGASSPAQEPQPRDVAGAQDAPAAALGTGFTYQGKLDQDGTPHSGDCDFQFSLWDALSGGSQIGTTQTEAGVALSEGLFTVELDFGSAAFGGDARWLQIAVRCPAGSGDYTTLDPRQPLTAAPYALYAPKAPWSGLIDVPAGFADGVDNDTTSFWSLTGNAGTTPGTHFLGTTDGVTLSLVVSGTPGLRLEPNLTSPNLIGGYEGNWVASGVVAATIGGGGQDAYPNRVTASFGTVAGGRSNSAGGYSSAVGGGFSNDIGDDSFYATIGGGRDNDIGGSDSATIGGGHDNDIGNDSDRATIGGGYYNDIGNDSSEATIGGGWYNTIGDGSIVSTIGGGYHNDIGADSDWATIGGGWTNVIGDDSDQATIGGGRENDIGDDSSWVTIGGGDDNNIGDDSDWATINGGGDNAIGDDSDYATIGGGLHNEANAALTFAAGYRAKANHAGAFVWADAMEADCASERVNQFRVRANGGVRLDINSSQWFDFRYKVVGTMPPVSMVLDTSTGAYLSLGGVWTDSSDRNAKENYSPVDSQDVLSRLAELPVSTWNYKAEDPAVRHIGPTAQDFHGAFGLGADDTHLAALDTSGVALAAIQGLYEQNQELAAENAALKSQVSDLEVRLTALERGGVSRSSALGLPTWLLLGGLALVGGVVLLRRRAGGGR